MRQKILGGLLILKINSSNKYELIILTSLHKYLNS